MKRFLIFATLVAVSPIALCSESAAQEPDVKPAELQVLERYVGSWKETVVSKPALWTPEKTTTTIESTRQWILNGRMIENKGAWSPGDKQFLHLMTYDPQRKEFLQWYFASDSLAPHPSRGTWDEETQTFTFQGTLGEGIESTSRQKFLDKDTFTWTMVAKDKTGKTVLDIEARAVRKK